MFEHEMGSVVQSIVSGFKGMIISQSTNLNGCNRFYVEPKVDKTGAKRDGHWFDGAELVVIEKAKLKRANQDKGGPPSRIR